MPTWDDVQYLKFADERTRPARELLARVSLDDARHVIDLGCGPGNSTALLRSRWPAAHIIGVDSSSEMLDRARSDWPELEWVKADAAHFRPDVPVDLIFSNALLHWLKDHQSLVLRLMELLRPGGELALQMPNNFGEPSHRLMTRLGPRWELRFRDVLPPSSVGTPAFYYDLLATRARRVDVWQTTYEHVMADTASIVDWVKGTSIRPYLSVLSPDEQADYLNTYASALEAAYPPRADGRRLFSFTRLFVVATR